MIITPIMAFFGLMLVANKYERALIETMVGRMMLIAGVFLVMVGAYLLKRMIQAVET
jgi:Flp pilus assembly protein TadB